MKYLLSNYSSLSNANTNENLDIRQSYVCPVVSTYTSTNTYSYDGKYIHIENNGFFGADIIPDAYTKCRYVYNTASLAGLERFMVSNTGLTHIRWIVKCSWQESKIGNTGGTVPASQFFGNAQASGVFGITQLGSKTLFSIEANVGIGTVLASTDPLKPQVLKFDTTRSTSSATGYSANLYVDDVFVKQHSRSDKLGFFENTNGYFGSNSADYISWIYLHHLQMYHDRVLVHNLVPCKRNSDGQYGLYDTIDNTWHGHASLSGVEINEPISSI